MHAEKIIFNYTSVGFDVIIYEFVFFCKQVHGILRRSSSFNTGRIEHLYHNPQTHTEGSEFYIQTSDLNNHVYDSCKHMNGL